MSGEWRDEDTLRHLYHAEKMSQAEIAEELGCAQGTVCRWMKNHGIERREKHIATSMARGPLRIMTKPTGYEFIQCKFKYDEKTTTHHRLLAVAEYGFEEVAGRVVHHKNGIPWDNRPENIELLSDSEHKQLHAAERDRTEGGQFA